MNIPSAFSRPFIGCFILGVATGVVGTYIYSAVRDFLNIYSRPPLICEDYESYRTETWMRSLHPQSMPRIDIPKSAKDIMISDRSAVDLNVYLSFRCSPHDFNSYVEAMTNRYDLEQLITGHRKSDYRGSWPLTHEDEYWIAPSNTDYYYLNNGRGGGSYFGVDVNNYRVFHHYWTK